MTPRKFYTLLNEWIDLNSPKKQNESKVSSIDALP